MSTFFAQEAWADVEPVVESLDASADTYLRKGAANTNEGASPILRVRSAGHNRALVQFDQTEIEDLIGEGTLISAVLELEIETAKNNWGPLGRAISTHRLTQTWAEGNGKNAELPGPQSTRGTGDGATWNCAIDSNITNHQPECVTKWNGGTYESVPTDSVTITKGQTGTVEFDVTDDVEAFLSGTDNNGWLVRKDNETQNGYVSFDSREAGTPHLVITYLPPEPPLGDLELTAMKDSFVRSGADNRNEGANPGVRIQGSGNNRVLVAFDLTGVDTSSVTKATLVLNAFEKTSGLGPNFSSSGWGASGRDISIHRLLTNWAEGNGQDGDLHGSLSDRGTGEGVTWNCAVDPDLSNSSHDDCARWGGGDGQPVSDPDQYASATADPFLITNGFTGDVSFDVTADVQAGAADGWLIKKINEGASGQVHFHSKEGVGQVPTLLLEFD
ncbi:MAG: DNRLRE domain-containing protein [Candidatus Andersenbacteria bacterium]